MTPAPCACIVLYMNTTTKHTYQTHISVEAITEEGQTFEATVAHVESLGMNIIERQTIRDAVSGRNLGLDLLVQHEAGWLWAKDVFALLRRITQPGGIAASDLRTTEVAS